MNRKERTKILCHGVLEDVVRIAERIKEKHTFNIIEPPNKGLVMIEMRDSAQLDKFYLGEVLVTECKVMINDVIGLGIVRGENNERAQAMAIIDATYNAQLEMTTMTDIGLKALKKDIDAATYKEKARILKTKVNFETLYEEEKS